MPYRPRYLVATSPAGAVHAALHVYDAASGTRAGETWCGIPFGHAYPAHVSPPTDRPTWTVGRRDGQKVPLESITCAKCRSAARRYRS